jgi:Protein kinase domain
MPRYTIEDTPVGQGGFGKVRTGTDELLERKVAVKTLDPAWAAASPEDKSRFRREAKTLAQLSHPSIPAIYDVDFGEGDQVNEKLEIICQFIEGETLRHILETEDTVPLSSCRIWFDQLASALEHAHEKNIIHRDIKPENIIVSPDRKHCYIVDFGIALSKSEMERLTGSDNWIGTPGYMSPEQEQGEDVDSSDDLYVLGGCLYEALCGHRIEQGNYQSLSSINELVPPAIDALIKRCIAPKPRRLKSATEFRNQLRLALQGHRTFSEVLANGQLHEVVAAIGQMSAAQFMELKVSQRLLILQKCADVVVAQDRRFAPARSEFLAVMTRIGIHLEPEDYEKIIVPALNIGFGAGTGDDAATKGVPIIRDSLAESAQVVEQPNHHIIVKSVIEWIEGLDLKNQRVGLYHRLRLVLCGLMANQHCSDEDAPKLGELLRTINDLQRTRAAEPDNDYAFVPTANSQSFG